MLFCVFFCYFWLFFCTIRTYFTIFRPYFALLLKHFHSPVKALVKPSITVILCAHVRVCVRVQARYHPSNTPSKAGAHPYTLGGLCPVPKPNKNRTKKYLAIYPYKKSFPQPPHPTPHPCYLTEFSTGFPQGKIYIKKLLHTRTRHAIIRLSYKFKSEGKKI